MNDRWNTVRLGECCEIVSGSTPSRAVPDFWNGDIPWVTPKDLSLQDEAILEKPREYITQAGYRSCSTRLLPKGAVLFSSRAPIGLVAIAGVELCTNQGLKSFVPGADVDSRYLYHYLKTMAPRIEDLGSGATFKEISRDRIRAVEIPLPPLIEQKRLAAILDQADALRQKRKESLKLLEEFIRSVFLEMFGDPVVNPKGWKFEKLVDVTAKITDGEHLNPARSSQGQYLIMAKDINVHGVDFSQNKFVSDSDFEKYTRKCKPERGDIVLVSRGATIGRCTTVTTDIPFCLMGSVILIKLNGNVKPRYIETLFRHSGFLQRLIKVSSASAQQAIYITNLKELRIPLPDLQCQTKFERVVEYVHGLKSKMAKSSNQLDYQFNSLVQRAFRGEL